MIRNSNVDSIYITGISLSSIIQIGESNAISNSNAILTIQKQSSEFNGKEGNFNDYDIFRRSLPVPHTTNEVNMNVINVSNDIHVGVIKLSIISASSVFHIGSTNRINALEKIQQVWQYNTQPTELGVFE